MGKSKDNLSVMMEKPDDLTLEQCQEAFAIFRQKPDDLTLKECQEAFAKANDAKKVQQCLFLIMRGQGLCHIREQIFGYLRYETLENCRKVSKLWKDSLERIALIKCIEEFGDREVKSMYTMYNKKVSAFFPGWKNAAQKYGVQASTEDLEKVNDSLKKLARGNGKCCEYPVHEAAGNGDVKLMELIFRTSFDVNDEDDYGTKDREDKYGRITKVGRGRTAFLVACQYGQTEIAQLFIQSSKEFGIDLNTKNNSGRTALHVACFHGKTKTVQMILKNWKEFGIDIKAQDTDGKTALEYINHRDGEEYNQIKKMLEKEYSQIDVTESVENLNLD